MSKLNLLFVFLFCCKALLAQDFLEAYQRAHDNFLGAENVGYSMTYITKGGNELIDQTEMKVEQFNGTVYTQVETFESYAFDSMKIIVDHSSETILLNSAIENNSISVLDFKLIEEVIDLASEEVTEKIDNESHFKILFEDQRFKTITMIVGEKDGMFKRMIYELSEPLLNPEVPEEPALEKVEIHFTNYQPLIEKLSKPLSAYLYKKGDRYAVQKAYSNYQFVNDYDIQ